MPYKLVEAAAGVAKLPQAWRSPTGRSRLTALSQAPEQDGVLFFLQPRKVLFEDRL